MHGNGRRLQDGFHSCPIAPAQPGLALATRKEGSLIRICIVRPLANTAVTLELSETVGAQASMIVAAAYDAIEQAIRVGDLPGVLEVAAAFCSVTLHYDCLRITQSDLLERVAGLLESVSVDQRPSGRHWLLPCCYDGENGADLVDLSETLGLARGEIVAQHAAVRFYIYALGFLPGLPFLGDLPDHLARPRRHEPRTHVPAGSVAIANRMCVIYPWVSPGGWHIVGKCPVPMFDITRKVPSLFAAGDTIRFVPVTQDRFDALKHDLATGAIEPHSFLEGE